MNESEELRAADLEAYLSAYGHREGDYILTTALSQNPDNYRLLICSSNGPYFLYDECGWSVPSIGKHFDKRNLAQLVGGHAKAKLIFWDHLRLNKMNILLATIIQFSVMMIVVAALYILVVGSIPFDVRHWTSWFMDPFVFLIVGYITTGTLLCALMIGAINFVINRFLIRRSQFTEAVELVDRFENGSLDDMAVARQLNEKECEFFDVNLLSSKQSDHELKARPDWAGWGAFWRRQASSKYKRVLGPFSSCIRTAFYPNTYLHNHRVTYGAALYSRIAFPFVAFFLFAWWFFAVFLLFQGSIVLDKNQYDIDVLPLWPVQIWMAWVLHAQVSLVLIMVLRTKVIRHRMRRGQTQIQLIRESADCVMEHPNNEDLFCVWRNEYRLSVIASY